MNQSIHKVQDFVRGKRIYDERKRLKLSQSAFAEAGNVSKGSQILYEKGSAPTADYLAGIALAGADVLFILTGVRADPGVPRDIGKSVTVDRFRYKLCFAIIAEEYQAADIPLDPMAQGIEAMTMYSELMARATDPDDGDEMEAIIPLLRHMLRKRLRAAKAD
ncbi:MAG: helix-turn-helix transcriptional regulator [Rhodobacterales bacterium]|nr:helix-turn-helix transcriptional regulator [Rhodobacterales bacterium]